MVNRTLSEENKLLTLTSDVGEISPAFDSDVNNYTITVPEKTNKITLEGSASVNSVINGLGTSDVSLGEQTRKITVTSQSGEVNTYTINIIRPSSNNVNLISLTPSVGELSPTYDNSIEEYTVEVSDATNLITFEAVPEDSDAKVEGMDIKILEYGENEITIKVTAEDQITTKEIKVKVIRPKDLISIIPSESEILIEKDEEFDVTYELEPLDTSYPEVEWKVLDNKIATVDETGKIKGIKYGSTMVQIVSKHDSKIYASITVNVVSKKIASSVYEVVHFSEEEIEESSEGKINYVIGFEPKTKIEDIIDKFDNNENTLYFYDNDDNEIYEKTSLIATGMKIKLIINGKEYDEVTIVVRGDINKDGIINVNDTKKLNNNILKIITFDYIEKKAADSTTDEIVNVNDYKKLNNYILKNISSLN